MPSNIIVKIETNSFLPQRSSARSLRLSVWLFSISPEAIRFSSDRIGIGRKKPNAEAQRSRRGSLRKKKQWPSHSGTKPPIGCPSGMDLLMKFP
jgi:hypothetical protein